MNHVSDTSENKKETFLDQTIVLKIHVGVPSSRKMRIEIDLVEQSSLSPYPRLSIPIPTDPGPDGDNPDGGEDSDDTSEQPPAD